MSLGRRARGALAAAVGGAVGAVCGWSADVMIGWAVPAGTAAGAALGVFAFVELADLLGLLEED
jgi:hypothetical protein